MVGSHEPSMNSEDLQLIQGEWLRRVEAEYRSAAITHHLTLWLMQLVAPLELIRAGLAIVEDEIVHSELSYAVYAAAEGSAVPHLPPQSIGLMQPPPSRLLEAVVSTSVETFCLGETVAVRLFSRLRADCTEPSARVALDRILRDEVRHRDFGWTLLDWLLSTPQKDQVHHQIESHLPGMFARLRKNYGSGAVPTSAERSKEQAKWGLMPPTDYAEVVSETLQRDYVPRFESHNIDALRAWNAELPKS
jgi:hypothetical protein